MAEQELKGCHAFGSPGSGRVGFIQQVGEKFCLGTCGAYGLRRIHPIVWAIRHTVPRAYLASTLLDALPHPGPEGDSPN